MATCVANVTKALKAYLDPDGSKGIVVLCKKLTGKGLHTYIGLIGYCLKDSAQPHFRLVKHNISQASGLGFLHTKHLLIC